MELLEASMLVGLLGSGATSHVYKAFEDAYQVATLDNELCCSAVQITPDSLRFT